jgi:hypothetical protein
LPTQANSSRDPNSEKQKAQKGLAQWLKVVDHLPSKHEALSLIPITTKTEKQK